MNTALALFDEPAAPVPDSQVFRCEVYGTPQPAGSKRAFTLRHGAAAGRAVVVDANPKAAHWKNEVARIAFDAMQGRVLFRCALAATFTFIVRRPKGHYGKRGLLDSAPKYPTTRPDALKLTRGVEDALSGIVYADDSLIVTERIAKRYGEQEGVIIEIRPEL